MKYRYDPAVIVSKTAAAVTTLAQTGRADQLTRRCGRVGGSGVGLVARSRMVARTLSARTAGAGTRGNFRSRAASALSWANRARAAADSLKSRSAALRSAGVNSPSTAAVNSS